ncbi:MAG: carboxypeptidase regulatory-like domain-containing protein [Bacteroidota bacterium]|nr:carboxypeptidase regulatory-like domain-containing protein [Bacteroidota bacterium]
MKKILFLVLIGLSLPILSQRQLAYEMMDQFEYYQAINCFSKVSEADLNDEDLTRLAFCYMQIHDNINAEKIYSKVVAIKYVNPVNYKFYGVALKNNGKYDLAIKYLKAYHKIDTADYNTTLALLSANLLQNFKTKQNKNVKAVNVVGINTKQAQLTPKLFKDGILFVNEIKEGKNKKRPNLKFSPDFKEKENLQYGLSERPISELFYASLDNEEVNNQTLFAKDTTYHIGALDIDKTTNEIYFTKTDLINEWDAKNTSVSKLYKAKIDESTKKFTNLEQVVFEGKEIKYSIGHPAISSDGKYMVFVSNITGGFGGSDLYVSEKKGAVWSTPVNLGAEVNSKNDEDFPTFYNNHVYFSSNGKTGFGGLDIFKADFLSGKINEVEIMPEPYNSSADDFGFCPMSDNESWGYFTSNRFGGVGDDDIYLIKDVSTEQVAKGKVLNKDSSVASKAVIRLLDENGKEIMIAKANEFGKFKFKLDNKKNYKVVASTPGFVASDDVSTITGKNVNKDLNMYLKPGTTAQGVVKNEDGSPAANISVKVYDENGNLIYETKTDENGYYQLVLEKDKVYNLVAGKGNYMGNVVIRTDKDYDTMSNTDIQLKPKSQVFGVIKDQNGKPASDVLVKLFDENGNLLATTTTDKNGNYKFVLVKDKNYQILASKGDYEGDENIYTGQNWDANKALDIILRQKGKPTEGVVTERATQKGIDDVKIVITDKSTNKKTILFTDKDGKFNARLRPNSEYIMVFSKDGYFPKTIVIPTGTKLPEKIDLNLDYDLAMDKSGYTVKAIYFDFGKATITTDSKAQLDLLADVMKNNPVSTLEIKAYADCRGSEQINLKLSIARSKSVKDYLIAKGIIATRISTQSMGATNFVNNCYKPEMCTEDEHALNRRAEFNINFEKTTSKKAM